MRIFALLMAASILNREPVPSQACPFTSIDPGIDHTTTDLAMPSPLPSRALQSCEGRISNTGIKLTSTERMHARETRKCVRDEWTRPRLF